MVENLIKQFAAYQLSVDYPKIDKPEHDCTEVLGKSFGIITSLKGIH